LNPLNLNFFAASRVEPAQPKFFFSSPNCIKSLNNYFVEIRVEPAQQRFSSQIQVEPAQPDLFSRGQNCTKITINFFCQIRVEPPQQKKEKKGGAGEGGVNQPKNMWRKIIFGTFRTIQEKREKKEEVK